MPTFRGRALLLRSSLTVGLLLAPTAVGASARSQKASGAERKALVKILKNRGVTARIDLPMRKGMTVSSDGRIDLAVYREKLSKLPVSIKKHERARITRVEIDDRHIRVALNFGGLVGSVKAKGPRPPPGSALRRDPSEYGELGTTIVIDYRRALLTSDLQSGRIARALRDVISIDGLGAAVAATPPSRTKPVVRRSVAPTVRLLAVEVVPARVRRGQPIELVVRFDIGGSGLDGVSVVAMRQVLFGEKPLFPEPRKSSETCLDGLHSSSLELVVPAAASPGVYRFQGGVVVDGKAQAREVLFEVLAE